jgi:hypothetical protein
VQAGRPRRGVGREGNRPGLANAGARLRSGGVLEVWKLDRRERTVSGTAEFVADLLKETSGARGMDVRRPAPGFQGRLNG